MKLVRIKDLIIGEGKPKICIPIVGKTEKAILDQVGNLKELENDLIEIRIDYFKKLEDDNKVLDLLKKIRSKYNKPILFTFRTKSEGGDCNLSQERYFYLNKIAIESNFIDLVDVEFNIKKSTSKEIIELANKKNVKVIMSSHNFNKSLPKDEIISLVLEMEKLNPDITKIAETPRKEEDVLNLLSATLEIKNKYGNRPCITISMGELGKISRISGELFGSALTFGAASKTSAPGQINVNDLAKILEILKV